MDDESGLSPRGNKKSEVERVAKAIYAVQVQTAKDRVAEIEFNLDEMRRVMDVAITESDRAAAILLFSYAEDMMLEGIRRNVNGETKGGFSALVSPNGLLGTAHNRITFLAALRWISPPTYSALNIMRSIRNRFAHHVDCHAFDDKVIAGMITSIPDFERPISDATGSQFPGLRRIFLARALMTVYRLMHEIAVNPHAIAHHVDPSHVGGPFDDRPASIHELGLTAADCLLKLVPHQSE